MALNTEQVNQLFTFTQKKYVHYYDLQIELVDHLAACIEAEMLQNSQLNFETALQKVYTGFGIFGFSKIVQEKEQQAQRAGKLLFRKELVNLFRWPRFIFVSCLVLVIWQLTQWVSLDILFPVFLILWIIASVITGWYMIRDNRKQKKKLLLMYYHPQSFLPFLWFEYFFIFRNEMNNPYLFTFVAFFAILIKLASFAVYKNVQEQAMRQYPDAFVM